MNTIHPSAQRAHSVMSSQRDAAPTRANDHITKRHANFTVRHDLKQPERESTAMSDSDSAALHASLTQSRQTWTHSAFSRLMTPDTSSDRQSSVQQHTHTTGLSLAGVCTVRIGPHIFLDTKFYTLSSNTAPPPSAPHQTLSDTTAVKQESPPRPHHQVAMEFKENPGTPWLFPEEASLELTPATDCESAQISASFYLPIPEKTEQGHTWTGASTQAINLVILQATTALWEGLQLAIRGPHITTPRSVINKRQSPPEDIHPPSTDDDDPSEILGSGKHTSTSSVLSSKRNPDIGYDQDKSMKSKRPRNQDEKSLVSSSKKTAGKVGTGAGTGVGSATATSKKSAPAGSGSSHSSQKKCGYCSCTTTPMWRRGPHGPSTLCNACGVKWKHGKIMQDSKDTQATQSTSTSASASSSKSGHGTGASAHRAGSSKTTGKRPSENGHDRDQDHDDKKAHSKTASRKSSAAPSRRDQVSPDRSSASRESSNGSRSVDSERIVPVKKRHLSKATPSRPPGPRMVPIHELDNVTRTPAKPQAVIDKYEDDDDEEERLLLNGRAKRRKNGESSSPKVSSEASSASTVSKTLDASENKDSKPKHDNSTIRPPSEALAVTPSTDDGLLLYSRNLYTNNTATFPLHFPTISIAFGPNNDYYTYPNCAVVLFENHFQIKLIHAGERTEIDVWKEGIEGTEFQVVDVGDGESMIVMKALLRQYLTRFDKELLNPDRNETLIVFRFRERLDGGGPFVKPLLEHWLATDIPVPPPTSADSA